MMKTHNSSVITRIFRNLFIFAVETFPHIHNFVTDVNRDTRKEMFEI